MKPLALLMRRQGQTAVHGVDAQDVNLVIAFVGDFHDSLDSFHNLDMSKILILSNPYSG